MSAKVIKYMHEHIDEFLFNQLTNPYTGMSVEDIRKEVLKIDDILVIGEVMGYIGLKNHGTWTGEWHNKSGVGFFLMPKGGRVLAHFQHSSQEDMSDCSQVRDLTHVEVECRRQNMMAWRFFKKYIPGFENAYITRTCPEVRIRETRRVVGDYKIVFDDVAKGHRFYDCIGKNTFPTGAKHAINGRALALEGKAEPPDGGSSDIPYRCMVVKGFHGTNNVGFDLRNFLGQHGGQKVGNDVALLHGCQGCGGVADVDQQDAAHFFDPGQGAVEDVAHNDTQRNQQDNGDHNDRANNLNYVIQPQDQLVQ